MESKNGNFRKYTNKNPLMRRAIGAFLDDAVSMVEATCAKSVLDVGCGEGFVSSRLCDKHLVGVDISRSALNLAMQNSPGAAFALGDIYRLPFGEKSFDLVMAMEVLEHLEEPEKAIAELGKLSKKYCLFSVPNEPYFRIMDLLRGKNIVRLGSDVEHVNHWSEKRFAELVSGDFDIVGFKKPFPWLMALCEKRQG